MVRQSEPHLFQMPPTFSQAACVVGEPASSAAVGAGAGLGMGAGTTGTGKYGVPSGVKNQVKQTARDGARVRVDRSLLKQLRVGSKEKDAQVIGPDRTTSDRCVAPH